MLKTQILDFLREWQPLIAAFSPILIAVSALIALRNIAKNADVNRRRATIDLIEKSESSEHYRRVLKTFKDHFSDQTPEMLERLIVPHGQMERAIRRRIQYFLNHYELIAIGILGGSLHERTYRSWMMSVFVNDWNLASDYIQRERWKYDADNGAWLYHPRVYEGFEKLARKWGKKCGLKVVRISRETSRPPVVPQGPGDAAVPRTKIDEDEVSPESGPAES